MKARAFGPTVVGLAILALVAFLIVPMVVVGGSALLFAGGDGASCTGPQTTVQQQQQQPKASTEAANSIPSDYLKLFQKVGLQYNVSWTILAGIGKVESDDGRSTLPGVHSGQNGFGAAGPMQIGIGGASSNTWGGLPQHPASEVVDGIATDGDGDGIDNVYDPADAIAAAAKYLTARGVQQNVDQAIFAYNHADWYVQEVLSWASTYAAGGFTVVQNSGTTTAGSTTTSKTCTDNSQLEAFTAPNAIVSTAISYAEAQIGKPYLYAGVGPDSYDCSGLVMMAYRSAGVNIERTSEQQFATLPHVPADQVQPGDLVFFAGADGTLAQPGHVALVIGKGKMIEAYATGTTIRISTYGLPTSPEGDNVVAGFAQPWPETATKPTK